MSKGSDETEKRLEAIEKGLKQIGKPKKKRKVPDFFKKSYSGEEQGEKLKKAVAGPWQFTWQLVFRLILIAVIIAAIVIPGIFIYNAWRTGTLDVLGENVIVRVRDSFFWVTTKLGLQEVFETIADPTKPFTQQNFDVTQADEERYIRISDVNYHGPYYSDKPIEVTGAVDTTYLGQDATFSPYCEMSDYDGGVESDVYGEDELFVKKEDKKRFPVTCIFADGISVQRRGNVKTSIASVSGYIGVKYDTTASSNYKVCGYDFILDYEKSDIRDENLGRTVPDYESPMQIAMGTFYNPLEKGKTHELTISFYNAKPGSGELNEIEVWELLIPSSVEVDENGYCDFKFTGRTDNKGNKIYTAKEGFLAQWNIDCSTTDSLTSFVSRPDCISLLKDDIRGRCDIILDAAEPVYCDFIKSRARYTQITKQSFITTVSRTLLNRNLCQYYPEEECDMEGCMIENGCVACPEDLDSCIKYAGFDQCQEDSCHFDNCVWNEKDNRCVEA